MAKTAVAKTENGGLQHVAGAPPAELMEELEQDAGKGVSGSALDNIVPLIYKLHQLSPQTDERHEQYIQGAVGGDIWLRNAPNPIVKGNEGILFQPAYFNKDWVEWAPNRGGYINRHPNREMTAPNGQLVDVPDVKGAREVPDPQDPGGRKIWKTETGNELVLTRNHVGFAFRGDFSVEQTFKENGREYPFGRCQGEPMPYVIPMTGASHTVSRTWMTLMNQQRLPQKNAVAASWSCVYRLTTVPKRNQKGSWAEWSVQTIGWFLDKDDRDRGRVLYEAFHSGEKTAEAPVSGEGVEENRI